MKQRTEAPTPRRLRQAREEGDHAVSQPLIGAASLAMFALFAPGAAEALQSELSALLRGALAAAAAPAPAPEALLRPAFMLSLPLLALCAAAALATGLVQTGGFVSLSPLRWDLRRLDPTRRWSGPPSGAGWIAALRVAFGAAAMAALGFVVLRSMAPSLPVALGDAQAAVRLAAVLAQRLLGFGAALLLGIAALDWIVVRGRWLARHRMSREEVARERRENEGDPEQKRLRQRVYREWLEGGELGLTAQATLIVIGPPRWATALRYDGRSGEAPRVLVQAPGALGRALLVAAYGFRVPVWHDPELAQRLGGIAAGEPVPVDAYAAVAAALIGSGSIQPQRH